MTDVAHCQWLEPGGLAAAATIANFLDKIGIPLDFGAVPGALIPGIDVRQGAVRVDPATGIHPGDMLHEAGHLAVTDPGLREDLTEVPDDPGEEMAAMAWSAAAALACGLELAIVFHEHGYKGGAQAMRDAFAGGNCGPGVPMLTWYGMTAPEGYPAMARWLR